ncbi:glycine receptor subunit alpha-2-like [Lepeophtheirus salmonis]|uniref:glycine receptor subunit alpha-2-like n=1 Tax=Lepeophtheirus salmonis TaxID=72036 RepID=UPI001AE61D2B|nr:glycine receptor subunit alpha-2-like [Lepeophtheirus salmonis]
MISRKLVLFFMFLLNAIGNTQQSKDPCSFEKADKICLPKNYAKYELPDEDSATPIIVGVDIKDIPKINDVDFSITLNAYFYVKWVDKRLRILSYNSSDINRKPHMKKQSIAINSKIIEKLWLPDVEILNLSSFETLSVLSKLEGVWIGENSELMYSLATRITIICRMKFNAFPMDIQVCKFQVGSFNYDMNKMIFFNDFIPSKQNSQQTTLDYQVNFQDLRPDETHYLALGMNYSVAGFQIILTRKVSFYIVTYYLPSALFVLVSWISFLVNPEVIPGRMTLLVTIFLVLINIFNTIQTNSPKADGLTAIEAWVIACIIFVFGALGEYTVILLKIKIKKIYPKKRKVIVLSQIPNTKNQQQVHNKKVKKAIKLQNSLWSNSNVFPKKIDKYAHTDLIFLAVFPILFLIFNLFYWITLYYWRLSECS